MNLSPGRGTPTAAVRPPRGRPGRRRPAGRTSGEDTPRPPNGRARPTVRRSLPRRPAWKRPARSLPAGDAGRGFPDRSARSGSASYSRTVQPKWAGSRITANCRKNSEIDRACTTQPSSVLTSTFGSGSAASAARWPHSLQYWYSALNTQTRWSSSGPTNGLPGGNPSETPFRHGGQRRARVGRSPSMGLSALVPPVAVRRPFSYQAEIEP
jgi:hypothetical protein